MNNTDSSSSSRRTRDVSSKRSGTPTMVAESEPTPQYRSMSLMRPASVVQSSRHSKNSAMSSSSNNTSTATPSKRTNVQRSQMSSTSRRAVTNWSVSDTHVRHIPSFYPLETSSRSVHDTPANIASRISDCCRLLSVQAEYNDELATAELKTEDHVEIHVTLWNGDDPVGVSQGQGQGQGHAQGQSGQAHTQEEGKEMEPKPIQTTIIEAQRRKGCAVMYHRYCRNLLDAAAGNFMAPDDDDDDDDDDGQNDGPHTPTPPPRRAQYPHPRVELKMDPKVSKLKSSSSPSSSSDDKDPDSAESSLLALEIAASLLSKDRMDARRLGMESLCLLTDPTKTGMDTAVLASQLVLFGSVHTVADTDADTDAANSGSSANPNSEEDALGECLPDELGIREAILSLVQFGRLGDCYGDLDSDDDDHADGNGNNNQEVEDEFNQILHNLALAVLANALEVLEMHKKQQRQPPKMRGQGRGQMPMKMSMPCANTFLEESKEMTNRELLSSLLNVLGKAESKPHDACLSAQCLRSLFHASKEAKKKAKELNAKQIVMTALDVGQRTHVKLEKETQGIIRVLERNDTDVEEHSHARGGSVVQQEEQQQEDADDDDDDEASEEEDGKQRAGGRRSSHQE